MSALTGLTGTSIFGGVRFWLVQRGDRSTPTPGRTLVVDIKHIPYGDTRVIQKAGRDREGIDRDVLLKAGDVGSFVGQVGNSGGLTLNGVGVGTALLTSATNIRNWHEGFAVVAAHFEIG